MRSKAASTCRTATDVDIMRIGCSCFVKNFANEVEYRSGAELRIVAHGQGQVPTAEEVTHGRDPRQAAGGADTRSSMVVDP